jgi:hypothetical protein
VADRETLWEYTHRVVLWDKRNNPVTPVLAFDQFEETFTLGRSRASVSGLLTELADLVENYIPAEVRSRAQGNAATIPFPHDEPHIKVVFSLREDFVSSLDTLRKSVPSVMHNRCPVARMNGEQAFLAVREPGRGIVDEGVARRIVEFVASTGESRDQEVDPALLSVVCRELNTRRISEERNTITEDLLEHSRAGILDDFYERSFQGLSNRARVFVEDRLLTSGGRRCTVPLDDAIQAGSPGRRNLRPN